MMEVQFSSECRYESARPYDVTSIDTVILKRAVFEISDLNLCFACVLFLPPALIYGNMYSFLHQVPFPIDKSVQHDIVEKQCILTQFGISI